MPVAAPLIGGAASIASAAISKPKKAQDPNAYLQPYLQGAAQQAQSLYNQGGPQLWDQSTVAPLSDTTNQALQGIVQRAQSGSPLVDTAQTYVQQGLQQPISTGFGNASNPYAQSVGGGATFNPYARDVGGGTAFNPYAQSVGGGAQENPYASGPNPFGGATNPYLDATFNKALDTAVQGVQSRFAGAGRNIGAGVPVAGDIASSLAAQIYAPAYENERNRQQSYAQQQLGIGAQGFESGQQRNLTANLAGQGIGAQAFQDAQSRALQSRLNAQNIGAQSFDAGQSRNLQANLAAQNIGAQGYENAQSRALSDLTAQRQLQQNLLGYTSPLAAQDYLDLAQMQQAGQVYDTQNQAQLSDQVNRFNQQQQAPQNNLNNYLQQLIGLSGRAGQVQQPQPGTNYLSAGLGGALLGSALFPRQAPMSGFPDLQQSQLQWLQSQAQPIAGLF